MSEHLSLKWGTLKAWDLKHEESMRALRRFVDDGFSASAMTQRNTKNQKKALCDLIDAVDGEIVNDWSGEKMTKDEAKSYVMEYGASK